jgi:hypothetical protein
VAVDGDNYDYNVRRRSEMVHRRHVSKQTSENLFSAKGLSESHTRVNPNLSPTVEVERGRDAA